MNTSKYNNCPKVAVLIFTHKPNLEPFEEINFIQCCNILSKHPLILVCPKSLDISLYKSINPNINTIRLPNESLESLLAYNRTKISRWFYDIVGSFDFILTYELDSFVFTDELSQWCERGFDYIGAPWFEGYTKATSIANVLPGGNSGFSLRRVAACKRVLRSFQNIRPFYEVYCTWRRKYPLELTSLPSLFKMAVLDNLFHPLFNNFTDNEDLFWSKYTPQKFHWFRTAPFEDAYKFSFEVLPEQLFALNKQTLPFGCHKWNAYNLEFWKPHIESFGHTIPDGL